MDTVSGTDGSTLWHWRCVNCGSVSHGVILTPYSRYRKEPRVESDRVLSRMETWRRMRRPVQVRQRAYHRTHRRADPQRVA
jgi:hypothetical protein